jgi:hypothetical protein
MQLIDRLDSLQGATTTAEATEVIVNKMFKKKYMTKVTFFIEDTAILLIT